MGVVVWTSRIDALGYTSDFCRRRQAPQPGRPIGAGHPHTVIHSTTSASEGVPPVRRDGYGPDDIVGVLYAKDLFAAFNTSPGPAVNPRKLAREPMYIPETKNAAELLNDKIGGRWEVVPR